MLRFDPFYYRPAFEAISKIFSIAKDRVKTLKQLSIKITSGATPLSGGEAYVEKDCGMPFIRSGDINQDNEIDFDNLLYISLETHAKKLKSSQLKRGDLLIAIVGATIGQVSVYENDREANINQAIALVRLSDEMNPEYVKEFLCSKTGQTQLSQIKRPVARANINLDEIGSLKIICPSRKKQDEIVKKIQSASAQKRKKEAEAKKLLDSIDDVVLRELGIKMPEVETNNIFEVGSEEIQGRIDPVYYSLGNVYKFLDNLPYKVALLGDVIEYMLSGFASGKSDQDENGVIQLRPTNIDEDRQLKFDKNILVKRSFLDSKSEKLVKKREVLFNNTNSQELVGKTVFFDLEGNYFCSNHITRIKTSEKLEPEFLTTLLNLYQRKKIFFSLCTNWNNQSGVNIELLKTIKIPLPKIAMQEKIIAEIKAICEKAKKLRNEAEKLANEAQQQVERMIFE
jgi:restriction endonuclease S subunit